MCQRGIHATHAVQPIQHVLQVSNILCVPRWLVLSLLSVTLYAICMYSDLCVQDFCCLAAATLAGLLSTWEIPDEQPNQWSWTSSSLPSEAGDLTRTHQCRLEAFSKKKKKRSLLLHHLCSSTRIYIYKNKALIHLVPTDFFSPGKLPCCRCSLLLSRESVLVSGHNELCQKKEHKWYFYYA